MPPRLQRSSCRRSSLSIRRIDPIVMITFTTPQPGRREDSRHRGGQARGWEDRRRNIDDRIDSDDLLKHREADPDGDGPAEVWRKQLRSSRQSTVFPRKVCPQRAQLIRDLYRGVSTEAAPIARPIRKRPISRIATSCASAEITAPATNSNRRPEIEGGGRPGSTSTPPLPHRSPRLPTLSRPPCPVSS